MAEVPFDLTELVGGLGVGAFELERSLVVAFRRRVVSLLVRKVPCISTEPGTTWHSGDRRLEHRERLILLAGGGQRSSQLDGVVGLCRVETDRFPELPERALGLTREPVDEPPKEPGIGEPGLELDSLVECCSSQGVSGEIEPRPAEQEPRTSTARIVRDHLLQDRNRLLEPRGSELGIFLEHLPPRFDQ